MNIDNKAYEADYDGILTENTPALLHLNVGDGCFVVLEKISEKEVGYYNPENGKYTLECRDIFLKKWSRVALYATKNLSPMKKTLLSYWQEYDNKLRITILFSTLGILFTGSYLFSTTPLTWLLFFCIKILGLTASIFLTAHSFNIHNKVMQEVCHFNKHTDCQAVLTSPASKLFGLISLSDVGIVYFAGGITAIVLSSSLIIPDSLFQLLYYISLCTLPYTLFSAYYQAFIVKKWCPFCITVLVSLWLECIVFHYLVAKTNIYTIQSIGVCLFCFFSILTLWLYLKPLLEYKFKMPAFELAYFKLKRNPNIFLTLYQQEKRFQMNYQNDDLCIGDIHATITITTLINPFCKPCLETVNNMIKFIGNNQQNYRWIIRFDGLVSHLENEHYKFPLHLIEYYKSLNDKQTLLSALQEWYITRNYNQWASQFPIPEISIESKECLKRQLNWVRENTFNAVPIIFINNRKLPKEYGVSDLTLILANTTITKALNVIK